MPAEPDPTSPLGACVEPTSAGPGVYEHISNAGAHEAPTSSSAALHGSSSIVGSLRSSGMASFIIGRITEARYLSAAEKSVKNADGQTIFSPTRNPEAGLINNQIAESMSAEL